MQEIMDTCSNGSLGKCRFCQSPLQHTFVDLGMSPLCEDFLKAGELKKMEPFYPLHVYVCAECFLVQLEEFVSPSEIYRDYKYFSSYSDSWLEHSRRYTNSMLERFNINENSLVAELASNDGYLLQYFAKKQIPVLGVEPAANAANIAIGKGVRTEVKFFGNNTVENLICTYGKADLLIGNNVLAHVPDINDFVSAMKLFLKADGLITMEFPHLLTLVQGNQFDTIYHEHFSYLSFTIVDEIFKHHGLRVFDVEEIPTHGGSLRIYGKHQEDKSKPVTENVFDLLLRESSAGMGSLSYYTSFGLKVNETKRNILKFFIQAKEQGKTIVGYGAPGKGNTLLNYCGIRTDFIDYTVDRNPHKHGRFLPGTLIPIHHPDRIRETRPDYVFILPWNLTNEIVDQLEFISDWGGKFVVPIPELKVFETSKEMV
jgi:2-polyprenyl-3-methyl-5-hydroxy-6-metoxy-1,4-benzoquinol methylase